MCSLQPPTARSTKRLFRFSLRMILAVFTLLCIALGWWVVRAERQRRRSQPFGKPAARWLILTNLIRRAIGLRTQNPGLRPGCDQHLAKIYFYHTGWCIFRRTNIQRQSP